MRTISLVVLSALLFCAPVLSAPYFNTPHTFQQPDGTQVQLILKIYVINGFFSAYIFYQFFEEGGFAYLAGPFKDKHFIAVQAACYLAFNLAFYMQFFTTETTKTTEKE